MPHFSDDRIWFPEIVVFVWWLTIAHLPAQTETPASSTPPERPAYQTLRFNEDWSVLKGAEETEDFLDPVKYIPLSEDGEIWLSFGGQLRTRFEYWSDFGFADGPRRSDEFLLTRLRLHADLHLGRYFRFFVEGKSAHSSDRDLPGGRRSLDTDEADLQNAFLDIMIPLDEDASLILRGGRQELLFGKQRLVSPLDWSNTRRTFEGFSAILNWRGWTHHAFYVDPVVIDKFKLNEGSDNDDFYGIYSSGKIPGTQQTLDLYWLGLERDGRIAFNGTSGEERRHTMGTRLSGNIGQSNFDYDVEGTYQFGKLGTADIDAWMVASQAGFQWKESDYKPRLYLGFDYSSGDNQPAGDVETFNQLFPLGHAYNGFIDILGRQNLIDLNTGISLKPLDSVTIKLDLHQFWRADDEDAVYNAGGAVVRSGGSGDDREIGQEVDLTVAYDFDRHMKMTGGYSHFFAGEFIDESGADEDIDFAYLSLQYTF